MDKPAIHETMTVLQVPQVAGSPGTLRFRITDSSGAAITQYDVDHEARLHLFSVDEANGGSLRDFQHLHPRYMGNGVWQLDNFVVPEGGLGALVGSFETGGRMADAQARVHTTGAGTPLPDASGGYRARFVGKVPGAMGQEARIELSNPDGTPVTQVGTYLGASAHLSLFRPGEATGQLNFDHGHAESGISGSALTVDVGALASGAYQGWIQFRTPGPSGKLFTVPMDLNW